MQHISNNTQQKNRWIWLRISVTSASQPTPGSIRVHSYWRKSSKQKMSKFSWAAISTNGAASSSRWSVVLCIRDVESFTLTAISPWTELRYSWNWKEFIFTQECVLPTYHPNIKRPKDLSILQLKMRAKLYMTALNKIMQFNWEIVVIYRTDKPVRKDFSI